MARVNVVKKAQKAQGKCERCGEEIKAGDSYKWIKPRSHRAARGIKRKRCMTCPSWRPSETTSSTALSSVYAAQENASDELALWTPDEGTADDLRAILQACADGFREGAEAYRESAQNIEDGFGHATAQSEELGEKADTLESSADDLESADVEDFDESEQRRTAEETAFHEAQAANSLSVPNDVREDDRFAWVMDQPGVDHEVYSRRVEELMAEARDDWGENVRSEVESAIDDAELP